MQDGRIGVCSARDESNPLHRGHEAQTLNPQETAERAIHY